MTTFIVVMFILASGFVRSLLLIIQTPLVTRKMKFVCLKRLLVLKASTGFVGVEGADRFCGVLFHYPNVLSHKESAARLFVLLLVLKAPTGFVVCVPPFKLP
jgi:hypothetical protein